MTNNTTNSKAKKKLITAVTPSIICQNPVVKMDPIIAKTINIPIIGIINITFRNGSILILVRPSKAQRINFEKL